MVAVAPRQAPSIVTVSRDGRNKLTGFAQQMSTSAKTVQVAHKSVQIRLDLISVLAIPDTKPKAARVKISMNVILITAVASRFKLRTLNLNFSKFSFKAL